MKQQCGETLGDLEPVYHLFTITGEITLQQAVTRVADARKSTVRRTEPKEENEPQKMLKRTNSLSWLKEDVKVKQD